MKKLFNLLPMFVLALVLMGTTLQAQEKFGHINTDELLRQMPARDSAQAELEAYAQRLERQFMSMQNEFQRKYQEFLEEGDDYSDLIRQSRQRELQSMQERIMEFQESAHDDLMQREERLLNPIINKAQEAIEAVAEENDYSYVFDTSTGGLVYAQPGDDLMPLVKEKLGLD